MTLTKNQIEYLNVYHGYDNDEWTEEDFEEMTVEEEVEAMLLTAINSVYTGPEVLHVYDTKGLIPQRCNNYLMSDDGETFAGVFVDDDDNEIPFTIRDNNGVWGIVY